MIKSLPCIHSVNMPCPTFVRKYIQARYLDPALISAGVRLEDTRWTPHKSDRIGKFFVSLLERAPARLEKYKPSEDMLRIDILNDYAARRGPSITQEGIDEFIKFIRLEIVEEVARYEYNLRMGIGVKKYDHVFMRQSPSAAPKIIPMNNLVVHQLFEKKEIMYDFLATFGITEDDFAYESLKKATYRLKLHSLSA